MWTLIARDAEGKEVARAELTDKPLTIGRGKDCGLTLPSGSVSRKHARIELRNGKPFMFDEGSANGSMVDGRRVVAPVELNNNSVIELTPFKLAVEGPPDDDAEEKTVMIKRPLPPPRPVAPPPAAAPPPPRPAPPPPRPAAPPLPAWTPPPPPPPPKMVPPPPPPPQVPVWTAPPPAAAESEWDAASSELDRHIQGIRSHREREQGSTQTRLVQLDTEWTKMVGNMQVLRNRLAGNPRLLGFNFGRDNKEVAVKIQDARERRGYRYFLISRQHPEGKFPGLDVVWLREIGREDMNFRDPKDAMSELLQRVAATLA